ncbi:Guanine-specific ribonuclease N1/T1 [Penicillium brevicompactum]|uniref:Guanine-specific ribonuclease N1/T1 n=1 Tax=Penicillium brevicompactum TaxID=5074 RepID=A0A9W9UU74_PENBR|nr:Guanine-specific ribonuclease N1/T1 [Penicillium brevicompactum]
MAKRRKTAAKRANASGQAFWHTNNSNLSREENKIPQATVQEEQLQRAPAPENPRLSRYPYKYLNLDEDEYG